LEIIINIFFILELYHVYIQQIHKTP